MSHATPTPGAAAAGATDPADLGVLEAARELRARRLSSAELTDAVLARIAARNGGEPTFDGAPDAVNAWARVYPGEARAMAGAADERRAREGDEAPLLCGIPLGLKDLYAVAGLPVTASSRMLEGNVATEDAVVWTRLKAAQTNRRASVRAFLRGGWGAFRRTSAKASISSRCCGRPGTRRMASSRSRPLIERLPRGECG